MPIDLAHSQTFNYRHLQGDHVGSDIKIFYQAVPVEKLVPGEYLDTLTFTILVN